MKTIIYLVLLLTPLSLEAATYWAHPNGASTNCAANQSASDPNHVNTASYLDFVGFNSGTWPFGAGSSCLGSGDTLMLKPGRYDINPSVWGYTGGLTYKGGTPSAYTTIRGSTENFNDTILFIGAWGAGTFNNVGQRYFEMAHLTVDASQRSLESSTTLFTVGSDRLREIPTCLNDLDADDCDGAAYIRWRNVKVDGGWSNAKYNGPLGTSAQGMGILGCYKCEILGGEWTRNIYSMYLGGEKNIVDGVWIHDNMLYGIQIYQGFEPPSDCTGCTWHNWELAHHQILRNNYFTHNGVHQNCDDLCGNPHIVAAGEFSKIYNNVFDDQPTTPDTPNRNHAIQIFGGCNDCEFYNNTITRADAAFIYSAGVDRTLVANNLMSQMNGPLSIDLSGGGSTVTFTNNMTVASSCFGGGGIGTSWQLTSGCPAINAATGTPAINVDANGVSRPQGGGIDIGACEFFSGATKCPSLIVGPPPPPTGATIAITGPVAGPRYITTVQSLILTGTAACLAGTFSNITWVNDKGGSGIATGTTNWTLGGSGATLTPYTINTITVTANCTNPNSTAQTNQRVAYNPPELLGAWSFDENSGTAPQDSSGKGNHGSFGAGVTYTSTLQKFGTSALDFNGTTGTLTIPSSASLAVPGGFSIVTQVRPDIIGTNAQAIFSQASNTKYLFSWNQGGGCVTGAPMVGFNDGATSNEACGTTVLPINTYSCVAGTYDGAELALYVNKIKVATVPRQYQLPSVSTPGAARIGSTTDPLFFMNGQIDEVRLYNYAITAAQVSTDCDTAIGGGVPTAPSGVKIGSVPIKIGDRGLDIGF